MVELQTCIQFWPFVWPCSFLAMFNCISPEGAKHLLFHSVKDLMDLKKENYIHELFWNLNS